MSETGRYVSRGGLKLEHALGFFAMEVNGRICLDAGSSTGGFTDCLLRHGAARVYAVDVGKGLLDWKLRNDPRVTVMEKINFKFFRPESLDETPSLVTADLSFISLTRIIPKIGDILQPGGVMIALVKPQFEADRRDVKKGIVTDDAVRREAVERIKVFASGKGFNIIGVTESPVRGTKGNTEYFICAGRG